MSPNEIGFKWVDDGNFIDRYNWQHEVVVGTEKPNSIAIPKEKASVAYQGKNFTYDKRADLISAWEANHPQAD